MLNIRRLQQGDYEAVMEHARIVHSDAVRTVEKVVFENPFQAPDDFVCIEDKGKIAAMAGLMPRRQRLGEKDISVGEMGIVGTMPEYRKRGYASRLIHYWIDHMKESGVPLSFLYGIGGFYQRFLYEYAAPAHFYNYVEIDKSLLKELRGIYHVRPTVDGDIRHLSRIYDENCRENPCSAIRSEAYWKFRLQSTSFAPHRWYSVMAPDESVLGYLWVTATDNEVTVREAGILDEEAATTLAEFLHNLAKDSAAARIGLKLPHNNPFARFLYHRGARLACTNRIYPGSWGAMYRIVDLKGVVCMLTQPMERRLAESKFHRHSGKYTLNSEVGTATLEIEQGRIDVTGQSGGMEVYIPSPVLTQLVTGYRSLDDTEIRKLPVEVSDLFKVLFPLQHPFIWDLEMSEELG